VDGHSLKITAPTLSFDRLSDCAIKQELRHPQAACQGYNICNAPIPAYLVLTDVGTKREFFNPLNL